MKSKKSKTFVGSFVSVASAMTALLFLPPDIFEFESAERFGILLAGLAGMAVSLALASLCDGFKGFAECSFAGIVWFCLTAFAILILQDLERNLGFKPAFIGAMVLIPSVVAASVILSAPENRFGIAGKLANVGFAAIALYAIAKITGVGLTHLSEILPF